MEFMPIFWEIDVMMIVFYFIFWPLLGGEMGLAAMWTHKGMSTQNLTKKSTHWVYLFGQLLSQNHSF